MARVSVTAGGGGRPPVGESPVHGMDNRAGRVWNRDDAGFAGDADTNRAPIKRCRTVRVRGQSSKHKAAYFQ
jgi:hypothetical protein